jgi:hypothetical protein
MYNMTFFVRNVTYCNGISEYDSKVCNGRGRCIATDLCTCNSTAFTGTDCQYCLGKIPTIYD